MPHGRQASCHPHVQGLQQLCRRVGLWPGCAFVIILSPRGGLTAPWPTCRRPGLPWGQLSSAALRPRQRRAAFAGTASLFRCLLYHSA